MVLFFAEASDGKFKKQTYETALFAVDAANKLGTKAVGLTLGKVSNPETLGKYGVGQVTCINSGDSFGVDSQIMTKAITTVAEMKQVQLVVISDTYAGKMIAGRISVAIGAGIVTAVNDFLKVVDGKIQLRKTVFGGKAMAHYEISSPKSVVTVLGNSIPVNEAPTECIVDELEIQLANPNTSIIEQKKDDGNIPLPEADKVVSAGRGMKGPENWGIIEELAEVLGAATACSRPVADSDWRPHHEHVGQTGVAIRPNLYIAIGISGAIQHLAGVNSSKTIVVINKDPEAPFFKAADYGVCADLFDVVPRLTEALKFFYN